MSDSITDRITVIIGGHTMWPSPGAGGLLQCLCGLDMLMLSEWSTHVAEAIVEQFGLIEETRTNGMSSCGMTTDYRTGVTTTHSDIRYDRRYTTPWEAE